MALTYTPKVGEVLECDFGEFLQPPMTPVYNALMPPEIRKRRMVVVLRISVNVTAHFANNVTGGFTRLRGV